MLDLPGRRDPGTDSALRGRSDCSDRPEFVFTGTARGAFRIGTAFGALLTGSALGAARTGVAFGTATGSRCPTFTIPNAGFAFAGATRRADGPAFCRPAANVGVALVPGVAAGADILDSDLRGLASFLVSRLAT